MAEAFTASELENIAFPPLFEPVPGLLCEGVHILAGRPKAGKSLLVLQLAVAIAGGHQALGWFGTNKVGVVYLALEDGDRRLQRRIRDIEQGWPDWLVFRTVVPGEMDKKLGAIEGLLAGFDKNEPAVLFIDTWGRFRPKKQGKDVYLDDYEPMAKLATLAQKRPQLSIVIVHHTKKLGDEGDKMEILEVVSGSYGLAGAADGIMVLDRKTGSKEATLTIVSRDTDERNYLLKKEGEVLKCLGEGVAGLKQEEKEIVLAIIGLGGIAGPSAVAEKTGANLETVKKRMQRMLKGEPPILARDGRGMYAPNTERP